VAGQGIKKAPKVGTLKKTKKIVGRDTPGESETEISGTDEPLTPVPAVSGDEMEVEEGEEGDVDNKKYCICQQVSRGNMVACDNDDCPYEWFHWDCVGVTKEPEGVWYCPECRTRMAK
jgi:inhibitor of growth protein 3